METTQLGHCPQTDPFDLKETHRDIGTITIVSSTIELGYVHGMACHLRSGTTSWLWRLVVHHCALSLSFFSLCTVALGVQ